MGEFKCPALDLLVEETRKGFLRVLADDPEAFDPVPSQPAPKPKARPKTIIRHDTWVPWTAGEA